MLELILGSGTIDTVLNKICFTPVLEGVYTFIVQATDSCNAISRDTIAVTIDFNSAPTANAGADQTLFQCSPALISWAASCSDIDGNLSNCALVSSTGTYNGTNISFTPVGSGSYMFILQATDACGISSHEIARELRYYVENDKIRLQNVTGPHGRKMKAWVWTESRPRAVEKKHKCLACQTNPVPGGREWVCPRCKNTEVWKGSSPYAIA